LGATLSVSEFWCALEPGCADVGVGFIARTCAFVAPARAQLAVTRIAIDSAIEYLRVVLFICASVALWLVLFI
jgi:hypothetical protein